VALDRWEGVVVVFLWAGEVGWCDGFVVNTDMDGRVVDALGCCAASKHRFAFRSLNGKI
jgi:hypothetical protein